MSVLVCVIFDCRVVFRVVFFALPSAHRLACLPSNMLGIQEKSGAERAFGPEFSFRRISRIQRRKPKRRYVSDGRSAGAGGEETAPWIAISCLRGLIRSCSRSM